MVSAWPRYGMRELQGVGYRQAPLGKAPGRMPSLFQWTDLTAIVMLESGHSGGCRFRRSRGGLALAGEFCAKSEIISGVHVAQCPLAPIVGADVTRRLLTAVVRSRAEQRTTNEEDLGGRVGKTRARDRKGGGEEPAVGSSRPSSSVFPHAPIVSRKGNRCERVQVEKERTAKDE